MGKAQYYIPPYDPHAVPMVDPVERKPISERYFVLKHLPEKKRQKIWSAIKEKEPETAKLMQNPDPLLDELMKTFNAEFTLSETEIKDLLK